MSKIQFPHLVSLLTFLLFSVISLVRAQNSISDLNTFELKYRQSLKQAYEASVFIADYDTISKKLLGPRFSGVVVSKDGLILTAAHTGQTDRVYLVRFPSQKRDFIAIGLGRIALFDASMLKIEHADNLPFAELGTSANLQVSEPCFSIAYAGSFAIPRPVLRLGNVAELNTQTNPMLRTTCLMEPGDSGGGLFDINGKVIGIRSNILKNLDQNFDVPIDIFRQYWTALQQAENYQFLPKSDSLSRSALETESYNINLQELYESHFVKSKLSTKSIYNIKLVDKKDSLLAFGTKFCIDKRMRDNKSTDNTYIISKSSSLPDEFFVILKGKKVSPTVIYRDKKADLVLLGLKQKIKGAINMQELSDLPSDKEIFGSLTFSIFENNKIVTGTAGTPIFTLTGSTGSGYLGLGLRDDSTKTLVQMVVPNSPASLAGFEQNDVIQEIDGQTVLSASAFTNEVQLHVPNDTIDVVYTRLGKKHTAKVVLASKPVPKNNSIAEQFIGGKSARRDNFENIFIHDAPILPNECGSIIINTKGEILGINLARFSRTTTVALSKDGILHFLDKALKKS
ncbi:trypsin-like peptidase domain-containing protein [Sphingobacterium sp. LRF_L2]|uniref:trypsin-like peptidase domain-containing protein n=1 Tax=Sphingobacterium sp. LRF_L2 TaxID=3369421 RepID=UPI003F61961A